MGQLAEFASNHPLLVLGLMAAVFALLAFEIRLKSQGLTSVAIPDAVRLINSGAVIVDVRAADEFATGHVVNARNVPMPEIQSADDPLKKQRKKTLLTVCDTGLASSRAANVLRKAGYEKVFSLKGGLRGWQQENLPLVK
jgi:rhodanese-related sulfurtransferase